MIPSRRNENNEHMSTTMTLTMVEDSAASACPNCGIGLPGSSTMLEEAQKRIDDLEAQVKLLNAKCTSAGKTTYKNQDDLVCVRLM